MCNFGFCNLSLIPVRAKESHSSEMVNQLLFGETFEILETLNEFVLIRGTLDNYEGFISRKQFLPLTKDEYEMLMSKDKLFPVNPISTITETNSGNTIKILHGSSLRGFEDGRLVIASQSFFTTDPMKSPDTVLDTEMLVQSALQFLNAPYLWGGRSLFGIDCSGLTQIVYNIHSIGLQRDSRCQAQQGETIHLLSEALSGDLAFFDDDEGNITHVGIIINNRKIVHASGMVRIDDLDHHGIFNQELKKYTHKLRLIKRMLGL